MRSVLRPLPASSAVSVLGATPNVMIQSSRIPFFKNPVADSANRLSEYANPGSVYTVLESLVSGEDLWHRVSTSGGPRWLVGRSGGLVYALPSGAPPVETRTTANGWPAFRSRSEAADAIETVRVPGVNTPLYVARGTGPAFAEMVRWWDLNVEPVQLLGSYVYRPMASNPNNLSLHSSGTAIDINGCWRQPGGGLERGCTLPYRERTIRDESLRSRIRSKAEELGLRWGGDWSGDNIDEMHFEIKMNPSEFRDFWAKKNDSGSVPVIAPVTSVERISDAARSMVPGGVEPKTPLARQVEEYAKFWVPAAAVTAVLGLGLAVWASGRRTADVREFL